MGRRETVIEARYDSQFDKTIVKLKCGHVIVCKDKPDILPFADAMVCQICSKMRNLDEGIS